MKQMYNNRPSPSRVWNSTVFFLQSLSQIVTLSCYAVTGPNRTSIREWTTTNLANRKPQIAGSKWSFPTTHIWFHKKHNSRKDKLTTPSPAIPANRFTNNNRFTTILSPSVVQYMPIEGEKTSFQVLTSTTVKTG
jgi:hypothetical protein